MKSFLVKIEKIWRLWRKAGFISGLKTILSYFKIYFKSFFAGSGDVLFITDGVGDSAHYRAWSPAENLRLHGFKTAVTISDNPRLPSLADRFQVFVFQRTFFSENVKKLFERAKKQKKEIIFDTDDLVFDPEYMLQTDYFQKIGQAEKERYQKGIGAEIIGDPYVRTATTTVSYLAEKIREYGKKVIIVPNKITNNEAVLAEKIIQTTKPADGFIRVAYASGTLSHNKDFATVKTTLIDILKKYEKVKLLLMGPLDIPEDLKKYEERINLVPFLPRKEFYRKLYEADINLAPLEIGNPFCESKSEIKFTGAGILGIPTVAVKNQTYSEAIEDGVDGFLADNAGEWTEKISRLVEDENLRHEMGEKARQKVLERYTNQNDKNTRYVDYIKSKLRSKS